jgi:hypothetical protein
MFCLYGMRSIGTSFEVRILVATFDTREAAEQYVQDSFVPHSERLIMRHPYHSASVLGAYTEYEIEDIPHNPVRNW